MMKKCNKCKNYFKLNKFRKCYYANNKSYYKSYCRQCECQNSKKYNQQNKKHRRSYLKQWFKNNPEYKNSWKQQNKDKINKKYKNKLQSDPCFKLRKRISSMIHRNLHKKNYKISIISILPYTMQELKIHLESQFEPWMTWDNWGVYNPKTWKDNDNKTWTWQIDHIIPQSILSYSSEKDKNFIKCWNLINLRPLNSKQNILDGCSRNRHNEVK